MEHSAVAGVAVIGLPDETAGQTVKAYVALKPGHTADQALRLELLAMPAKSWDRRSLQKRSRSPKPTQDPQRRDHAPPTENPRNGAAPRRYLNPRK